MTAPDKPKRRRRRAALRALVRLTVVLVVVVLLIGVAALAVTDRRLTLPDWVVARIETRINDRLPRTEIDIGGIDFAIPRDRRPGVRLRDVTVRDGGGAPIAVLDRMGAVMDPGALLRGELAPRRLRLAGAVVTLRRDQNGGLMLTLGGGGVEFAGLSGLLGGLERTVARPPLDRLETVQVDDLTVALEDARSGRVWQVSGGTMRLEQDEAAIEATVAAEIFNGSDQMAQAQISMRSVKADGRASLNVRLEGAPAEDIALQTPALSFLRVLDAPISGALRGTLDESGAPQSLAGTLEIGSGQVQPNDRTDPLLFESGRVYFEFDPARDRFDISELRAVTDSARVAASGHAYLRDKGPGGWPRALVSQISLSELHLEQPGVFARPLDFTGGTIDARLRLDPMRLDVGQAVLEAPYGLVRATGRAEAQPDGWNLATDVSAPRLSLDRALSLWPQPLAPGTRGWLDENVTAGELTDLNLALRLAPDQRPRVGASFGFTDTDLRVLEELPPVTGAAGFASLVDDRFALDVEAGTMTADMGGELELGGSSFVVADTRPKPSRAAVEVQAEGAVTAVLSLLTRPPVNLFADGARSPDLAEGRADLTARLGVNLGPRGTPRDLTYDATGQLTGLRSDDLLPGRTLTADRLNVTLSQEAVTIAGDAELDGVPATARWQQGLTPETRAGSTVKGQVALSQQTLDAFGISLPPGTVSGRGNGSFTVTLAEDTAPRLTLTSDLAGLGLSVPALNWSLPQGGTGTLDLAARLGASPEVERLSLDAPGLEAQGSITLDGGQLDAARFSQVAVGGWFNASVTLSGRGAGRPPAIAVNGGTLDMRQAGFGGGGGGSGGGQGSARGPIDIALDRLVLTEGIALTQVQGRLDAGRAVAGQLTGRVNGGPPLSVDLSGGANGVSLRLRADDAGAVISAAGFLEQGREGQMEVVLNPTGAPGTYEGSARVTDTRIVGAPTLAELLGAISVVGLVEQMQGQGLVFEDVQARFRLSPGQIVLYSSSAVGASLGLSLDGTFDLANRRMDMQGVVSPIYLLNQIGSIFTRRGEGLFGFNFRLTGPVSGPRVQVNPLSILTPGMFREIFRRAPPEAPAN